MQAIVTKFVGPTNHRGARIIATCEAGKLAVSWDYALSVEPNHHVAAVMLAQKLGWKVETHGQLVSGALPGAGYCHVFVKASRDLADDGTVPPCAASMGCLCAGHARGDDADAACDTRESRCVGYHSGVCRRAMPAPGEGERGVA